MLAAGDVLLVYCLRITPPHDKFVICVCPEREWFFFINSKPRHEADAQVRIEPYQLAFLDHPSWVDTSKIVTFLSDELVPAKRDRRRHKGPLSPMLRQRIKRVVRGHGHLPTMQADIVEANL